MSNKTITLNDALYGYLLSVSLREPADPVAAMVFEPVTTYTSAAQEGAG